MPRLQLPPTEHQVARDERQRARERRRQEGAEEEKARERSPLRLEDVDEDEAAADDEAQPAMPVALPEADLPFTARSEGIVRPRQGSSFTAASSDQGVPDKRHRTEVPFHQVPIPSDGESEFVMQCMEARIEHAHQEVDRNHKALSVDQEVFLAREVYRAGKTKNRELNYRHFIPVQRQLFCTAKEKEWTDMWTAQVVQAISVEESRKIRRRIPKRIVPSRQFYAWRKGDDHRVPDTAKAR